MGSYILVFIQYLLRRRKTILRVVSWLAKFGYWLYILYGIVAWFQPGTVREKIRRRETLWQCLFSVILGSALSWVIGKIWYRPRPFVQEKGIQSLISHRANASFPSNHSMNGMAIALQLLRSGNPVGWFFLPWSILIGASRVLTGVHFVTDILGGFLVGGISTAIVAHSSWSRRLAQRCNWYTHIMGTLGRTWYSRW